MKNFFKEIYLSVTSYLKTTDVFLFFMSIGASIFSLILLFSLKDFLATPRAIYIQLIATIAGIIFAIGISNIDYHKIKKFFKPLIIFILILNMLPFTPIGRLRENELLTNAGAGADNLNWISIGFTKIQPSEFLKIAFILTFSYHCCNVLKNINKPKVLFKVLLHALVPIGIIYIQKDYGTMSIFLFTTMCIILTANTNFRVILSMICMCIIVLLLFITRKLPTYLLKRIYVLWDLEKEKLGIGHQQYTARTTLATGKIFGKGFFSEDTMYSTSELHSDMIFAHIGQVFGFLGCLLTIVWIIIYCLRILQIAHEAKDNLGCLICVGGFAIIFCQAAINIGMALCIVPVVGIPLPFISAGGSSVFCIYLLLGVIISVHKHSYRPTLF